MFYFSKQVDTYLTYLICSTELTDDNRCVKYPYLQLFWPAFSRIWTEYYSIQMRKMRSKITLNTDTFHTVNGKMIGWYDKMMAKMIPTRSWNLVCTCSKQIVCFCKYNTKKPFSPCKYRGFKIGLSSMSPMWTLFGSESTITFS